jgi:hypothetical protein
MLGITLCFTLASALAVLTTNAFYPLIPAGYKSFFPDLFLPVMIFFRHSVIEGSKFF